MAAFVKAPFYLLIWAVVGTKGDEGRRQKQLWTAVSNP
jgi:hypothetical protein